MLTSILLLLTGPQPVAPAVGTYTLYVVVYPSYTYAGVLRIRDRSTYGFKTGPKRAEMGGRYVYKDGTVRFLSGAYKGESAKFTVVNGRYSVDLRIKKTDGSGKEVRLLGKRDEPKK
ncbi:hypothetical protein EON79_16585 [bacterium]|nr:MAG: hypothetical protein EON79_16585 [bacterium]